MKKVLLSAVMFVGITAAAQDYEKRVGVNTETPRASLEVKAINNGTAQGILFPHISETEKARWAKDNNKGLVAGTVIWNTTKICLDYFDGTNWQCTDGTKPNVHPTPWTSTPTPPPATTYTGTAIWGDDESISARRNNCPTGELGSSVTYPANNTQHITYTATSTVSQAEANQKALDLMNSSTEVAKRQQLAQDYANANGICSYKYSVDNDCVLPSPDKQDYTGDVLVYINGTRITTFPPVPTVDQLQTMLNDLPNELPENSNLSLSAPIVRWKSSNRSATTEYSTLKDCQANVKSPYTCVRSNDMPINSILKQCLIKKN